MEPVTGRYMHDDKSLINYMPTIVKRTKKTIWTRRCMRCNRFYQTHARKSRVCDNCKQPIGKLGWRLKNEVKTVKVDVN